MSRSPLILAVALLLVGGCDRAAEAPAQPASAGESTPTGEVVRQFAGTPLPAMQFADPDGATLDLGAQDGPVLINLWATWCAPCVKELPTIEALEKKNAVDGNLGIAIVSQDMGPKTSVDAFLKSKGISLRSYLDPEMKLTGALGVEVMPTTILYDARGREVWRYVGDLDWTGPEATKLLAEASVPNG